MSVSTLPHQRNVLFLFLCLSLPPNYPSSSPFRNLHTLTNYIRLKPQISLHAHIPADLSLRRVALGPHPTAPP